MSRHKFLKDLEAALARDPELAEEAQRYTRQEWESGVDMAIALELINPAYSTPEAATWLSHCYEVLATLQEKGRGEDMSAQDWELLHPDIDQVLQAAPAGLS
jgi:hypothetical protein